MTYTLNHGAANAQPQTPWFPTRRSNGETRLRLFCFPYAGGGALVYRDWAAKLPAGVEVCPAQLPGRGSRRQEPCYTSLRQIVEALAQVVPPLLDRPFAFFGHSMGALIAFELARELRRAGGAAPVQLFVSGRSGPQVPKRGAVTYDLPERAFIERLRHLNGTPREVLEEPEMMRLMIPLLRADFEVSQTYEYTPEPALACPITAFGGADDTQVGREDLAAWREQTSAGFSVRMLPGDHFFLNTERTALLQTIAEELRRRLSGTTPPRAAPEPGA
jgi:medium-chain acyl-[acyl-carrier-protein] hydrolase